MFAKKTPSDFPMTVRAINIDTNEVVFEGINGDEIIKKAEESGINYILDFQTHPGYNFIF